MNAITENPYRILGLFCNSNEKELQKQIAIINRFAEVGKMKSFEYDFPFLGNIKREQQTIREASSKIEQAKNKVHYSLFWFLNINHIDDAAFNHLKVSHIDKATEIWEKVIKDHPISEKNYSAAINLSTLNLGLITLNGSFDLEQFKKSIDLKGQIISSDHFVNFIKTVAGDNLILKREHILNEFVDEVLLIIKPYLNSDNGITQDKLIDLFDSFPFDTKKYVMGKFTDRPFNHINDYIEKTKIKRVNKVTDADKYGEELYKNTENELLTLKNILGGENIQYRLISDKLANEILQCAIDFFIEYRDRLEYDPGEVTLKLMKMAKSIEPVGHILERLDENIENINDWVKDKPVRLKSKKIKSEMEVISRELDRFQKLPVNFDSVNKLLSICGPEINNIMLKLNPNDELFLDISSAIVSNAQGMLISILNRAVSGFENYNNPISEIPDFNRIKKGLPVQSFSEQVTRAQLAGILLKVYDILIPLSMYVMKTELRENFNNNLDTIERMRLQLNISYGKKASRSGPAFKSSKKDVIVMNSSTKKKKNTFIEVLQDLWVVYPIVGGIIGHLMNYENTMYIGILIGLIVGFFLKYYDKFIKI